MNNISNQIKTFEFVGEDHQTNLKTILEENGDELDPLEIEELEGMKINDVIWIGHTQLKRIK